MSLLHQCIRRYPQGALYIPLKQDGTPMSSVAFVKGIHSHVTGDLISCGEGYLHAKGKYAIILRKNTTWIERILLKKIVFKYNEKQLRKKKF